METYVYLSREWELRVIFGLEVQFSCWNKYWSLGWLHWKSYELLDWMLLLLSLDFQSTGCECLKFFLLFVCFSYVSLHFQHCSPLLPLQLPSWNSTESSVSITVKQWGSRISDCFHPALVHAGSMKRIADTEMLSIYIHLVFASSTKYEWVLSFISNSILNSNVSHL